MTQQELKSEFVREYVDFDPSKGWRAGRDLYYECQICGDLVHSISNSRCSCRNVLVEEDSARAGAKDETKVKLVRLTPK